jgi:GH3 auxin-responsive promoter
MSLKRFLLVHVGRLLTWPVRRRLRRFERECENPAAIQAAVLDRILRKQQNTGFGSDHRFAEIRTEEDFRKNVPVAPYEYVAPYIERVQAGDTNALLADSRVLMFALTSGTTASRKLIPVTQDYLTAYKRGWNMWGVKMYRDHRGRRIAMRPIVQMVGDPDEFRTSAGIPCGNLTGFTAKVQMKLIRRLYAVPHESGKIKDPLAKYYVALRFAIDRNVSQFMAANPSTLVQLARTLDAQREGLLKDLHDGTLRSDLDIPAEIRAILAPRLTPNPGRSRELSAFAEKLSRLYPQDVWPSDATIVNTWTGGSMGPYLRQLPQYYGETPVRDLGLLASEGRMTIPFANSTPSGVLDILSHYFEFIPEHEIDSKQPTVLGAHEIVEGGSYYILPTTLYGLYRYHISDLVRVTGFLGRTPMVEFLGKGSRFANITGEKLSEHHVTKAMDTVLRSIPQPITGYTLSPIFDDKQPYYAIFLEQTDVANHEQLTRFLEALDRELGVQNIEYAAKRESGRLGPVRVRVIASGAWAKWDRERLRKTGGASEQYKRPCLIGDPEFHKTMPRTANSET